MPFDYSRSSAYAQHALQAVIVAAKAKNNDVSIPFRPIHTEVKWLFQALQMETGQN